jgi:hypothetical protein
VSEGIPYSGVQNRITPHERYLTTQTTTQIVPVVIPVHDNLQKQSPVRSRPGPWLQLRQSGAQARQHNSTERLSVGVGSLHRQQQVLVMANCMTPSFLTTQGIITQDVTSVNELAAFILLNFFPALAWLNADAGGAPAPTIRAK